MPEIKMERPKPKQVKVKNFTQICAALDRPVQHVAEFIKKQLKEKSYQSENDFMIDGLVTQDKFKTFITQYAEQYIKCPSCGSFNTFVIQAENGRDQLLQCESCKSQRHIKKRVDE